MYPKDLMQILRALPINLILLTTLRMISAAETPSEEATPLDLKGTKVQRLEVSASLIGFTSTKVFYTLSEHRVVVVIHIDNTKKGFPVTGKVCQFAKEVTPNDMAKWLNNQYSDALFPKVPEPKVTVQLPEGACQSLESKLLGQRSTANTAYNHYRVEFKLPEVKVNEQIRLTEFKDTENVYFVAK